MTENSKKTIRILIVAGEDSGDAHSGELVKALRRELPGSKIEFFGAAGSRMRAEGVRPVVRSDEFGIVGVPEVIRAIPMFLGVLKRLTDEAVSEQPDLAILVDFPEFNLKLAKRLKKRGFKVVYYISPQLWAWRSYRIKTIRNYVDLLITILPFENEWYESRGVGHTVYAGNPLAGKVSASMPRSFFRKANGFDAEAPLIALLPGSRQKEIERIFPVMLDAAKRVLGNIPAAKFAVVLAKSRNREEIERFLARESESFRDSLNLFEEGVYDVLNASDAAAVTSGTATLEAALVGTPQVIVYKTSTLNYILLKPWVNIGQFGLANLIAGKKVYSELLQNELNGESLSGELLRLLDPAVNRQIRAEAGKIKARLGSEDAATAAAKAVIAFAGL